MFEIVIKNEYHKESLQENLHEPIDMLELISPSPKLGCKLKYGFHKKYFRKNEPLTS